MKNIRMVTAKAATKEDMCVSLAYFQDALDIAKKLKERIEKMPLVVRALLEDNGADLEVGTRAEFLFLQSVTYLDQMIDCLD